MTAGPAAPGLGAAMQEELDLRIETLLEAARRVRGRGDDEAIHDLRVSARRLEAALDLWRGGLRPGPMARARRLARRARRRVGAAREREVHVALLERLLAAAPVTARLAAAPILDRLRRARARGRRRAASRTSPARAGRKLRRWLGESRCLAPIPGWLVLEDARSRRRMRAEGARAAVRSAAGGADTALHAARIRIKKWRYAAECLGAVERRIQAPSPAFDAGDAALRLLRRIQQSLGDAHDMATLRDRLDRETGRLARRGLGESAAALAPLHAAIEERRLAAIARFEEARASLDETATERPVPRLVAPRSATRPDR